MASHDGSERERPTIAVVIPLHNKGPHIERSLNSVLRQTRKPQEIIIVDDASTDDGIERVLGFSDPRIRVLRRDVPGPGGYAARNTGIEAATSDWIAFLDADDFWFPHALAEAEKLIKLSDGATSCVFLGYQSEYSDGSSRMAPFPVDLGMGPVRFDLAGFIDAWLSIGQSPMWTSAVTARREALLAVGGFPAGKCRRGGDKDTWIRLAAAGNAICAAPVVATYHRDSVNMVTKNTTMDSRPYLCQTLEAMLPSANPALARKLKRLINYEMVFHAKHALRAHARVDRRIFEGFFVAENPVQYALLRLVSGMPDVVLQLTHRLRKARVSATQRLRKADLPR